MEMVCDYSFILTTSSFDGHGRIKPFSILDYFQSAANLHANIINVGYDVMIKKNLGWLVSKSKVRILKDFKKYEKINVKTYPVVPGRADFDRCYQITNEDGEVLIDAKTKWAAVHLDTKRLARSNEVSFDGDFKSDPNIVEFDRQPKVDINELEYKFTYTCGYSHTDEYHHLNNARYGDILLDALDLKEDEKIYEFQINNLSELPLNNSCKVYSKRVNKTIEVYGYLDSEDNKLVFSALVKLL